MEPLTSYEMKALAGVTVMECIEETKVIVEYAKKREMPDLQAQENLKACWTKTHDNSKSLCGDHFSKLTTCLDNNERTSLKCSKLRNAYEECYVKEVMLKEQK